MTKLASSNTSNSETLASFWGDLIDWEKRRLGENGFLIKQLKKHVVKSVFDSALGDGCDSIYLTNQGFNVQSNEIDLAFAKRAKSNAVRCHTKLNITSVDWRALSRHLEPGSFDAVICLGNSFTYLGSLRAQLKALEEFRKILREGGALVIDERNYQYFLDNRLEILSTGLFRYSGKYVYCGKNIRTRPVQITDAKMVMEYLEKSSGSKGYITMHPFKDGELHRLVAKSGFKKVEKFSDYLPANNRNADFYQYVCQK